jgi:hypothetical protein
MSVGERTLSERDDEQTQHSEEGHQAQRMFDLQVNQMS